MTSHIKYLELDSTYRDRNRWPLVGEFDVLVSQSGKKDKYGAVDPVCLGQPDLCWTGNNLSTSGSGSINITFPGFDSDNEYIHTFHNPIAQTGSNYFAGLTITIGSTTRVIYSSEYIGSGHTKITFLSPLYIPTGTSVVLNDSTDTSILEKYTFFVPSGSSRDNAYAGQYLYNETLDESTPIENYDNDCRCLRFTSALSGWQDSHNYCIRSEMPMVVCSVVSATQNSVSVNAVTGTLASQDNFYVGDFIRIRGAVYGTSSSSPSGQSRRVVAYDSSSGKVTVSPPFTSAPTTGSWECEVLKFSYDNCVPFAYNGSLVSQQEMVSYEIRLLSLTLPNKILSSNNGGRLFNFPFVYVGLHNISSSSSGGVNTIYSNNPHTSKVMFRASIDGNPDPFSSKFIRINGDQMTQIVKFKPNDNLHFSIILPGGGVFSTTVLDTSSPNPPDDEIQVSSLFSLRRLS